MADATCLRWGVAIRYVVLHRLYLQQAQDLNAANPNKG